MKRWQLRLYRVEPGRMDDWVDEWRTHVLPPRESMGFEVLGPWAADAAYRASPERAALQPDPARLLVDVQTFLLDER